MNTHWKQNVGKDLLYLFFIGSFFLFPTLSQAAHKSNEPFAVPLIQSAKTLTLAPGEQTRFGIGFKNTSSLLWGVSDSSLLTLRSKAKKESYFYHSSWAKKNVVMSLPKDTKKGEVVFFWFTFEAPQKTGEYNEELTLYQGNTRIAESAIRIPITVKEQLSSISASSPKGASDTQPSESSVQTVVVPPSMVAPQLSAVKLIQSAPSLVMKQYERVQFGIGFKNTGGTSWLTNTTYFITLRSKASKESYFYDSSWKSGNVVMSLPRDVKDGELVYFWFTLFAPIFPRDFQEQFALYAGETKIAGSDVTIPITVVPVSSSLLTSGQRSPETNATLIETQLPETRPDPAPVASPVTVRPGVIEDRMDVEPFIRVGLYHTKEPIRITANKDYEVRDREGTVLSRESAGAVTTIVFDFASKQYTVTTPTTSVTTANYVRMRGAHIPYRILRGPDGTSAIEPIADQDTIFEILSYTNHPSWSTTVNDNTFRGEMEVRYAPLTDRLWVVNELLFEQYLKGIAETSNSSPYEYQKALIIAARTYAKYHIDKNSKNAADGFTVKPTEADQVYRGYGAEKRLSNISRAVDETRGVLVYYGDTLAITPYSSNTDGRTRSWEEVWGGSPKPWLVSKFDPCCTGMPMRYSSTSYSHGVGMSARGALAMALDNKSFEEILKYYYTNIELIRKY